MVKGGAPLFVSVLCFNFMSKVLTGAESGASLQVTFVQSWESELKQNQLVTVLPYMGKEYRVGFELLVTNIGADPWQSVIHLTLGGNAEKFGDRAPACWVANNKKLACASSIGNDGGTSGGWFNEDPIIELNKWYRVELSQTLVEGKYMYEMFIDGVRVKELENTKPGKFEQMKVFTGDSFYPAAEGKIRNLYIETRHG